MHLGHREALDWLAAVGRLAEGRAALLEDRVELVVLPTFPCLVDAVRLLAPVGVAVGAQDLSWADRGAYTGEVSGAELAEIGCRYAEVGHLERRRHCGETDETVSRKTAAAFRHRLTPLVCVGEASPGPAEDAARECVRQLRDVLVDSRRDRVVGPVVVAYEPHWAIGAGAAAAPDHVGIVCTRIRSELESDPALAGSRVLYGGSAGSGLLTDLSGAVDGLFLGRAAQDLAVLGAVLDEAGQAAAVGPGRPARDEDPRRA